jgi:peptidyl-prolyl cis-trans isomerase SurA
MLRFLILLLLALSLEAKMVDGVALVVKNQPITLYEIKQTMEQNNIDQKQAVALLIRKTLETSEIKQRNIKVTKKEIIDEIKRIAALNHITVEQFYASLQNSDNLTTAQIQEKIKKRIENQKLFQAIAFAHMYRPGDQEIQNYFQLHKKEFEHPSSYSLIIYQSNDRSLLQRKIDNPMFYSPRVASQTKDFRYNQISPQLAQILAKTKTNNFTPIVPNGQGGYMSFYIASEGKVLHVNLEDVRAQIENSLMMEKRQQVLSEYFKRLEMNADIRRIRMPDENNG